MSHAMHGSHRPSRVLIAAMSAMLVFALASVSAPTGVLGATVSKTAICSVNLRTSASTNAHIKALISSGTKVSVDAKVTGGSYRTACGGTSVSARTWYRITAVGGTSVRSLYGVSYVYGATSLFKTTPVTRYAACTTYLRTRPSTSSTARVQIKTGTKVLVATKVTGGAWSRSCAGKAVAGSAWYRISQVNGRTVKSLYGVSYLYAPAGLFSTTAPSTTLTTPGKTVNVSSIPALMTALRDNSVDTIVVADGTYRVDPASSARPSDTLYIGARYASRTRPVTVRAASLGGVSFDGGGGSGYSALQFGGGAHDQTWDGFTFANMVGGQTGIIVFGGDPTLPAPHHITLRHITLKSTLRRSSASSINAQGVYFAHADGIGPHDLLLADILIDGTDPLGLWSGIHAYHGDSSHQPSSNVTIRRLTVRGTFNPVVMWNNTGVQRNWLIDGATISGARERAIRFESIGATNIVFKDIVSTGSKLGGFYSSMGAHPPGVTFINDSLH